MSEITLDYVLKSRNINGEIYECDIKRFFGWDLSRNKIIELKMALNQLINRNVF